MSTAQPVQSMNMTLFRTRVLFFRFVVKLKDQKEIILDHLGPTKSNDKNLWKSSKRNDNTPNSEVIVNPCSPLGLFNRHFTKKVDICCHLLYANARHHSRTLVGTCVFEQK